jgi:hypothetical protein
MDNSGEDSVEPATNSQSNNSGYNSYPPSQPTDSQSDNSTNSQSDSSGYNSYTPPN